MHDRGMIKWAPFNSLINGKELINEIEKEKSKINKPILSDEQKENIQNNILESLINKIPLKLAIYKNGFINEIKGTVISLDTTNKRIILDNYKYLYFREIIKANIINI